MKRSVGAVLLALVLAAALGFAQYSGGGGSQTFTVPTLNVVPGPLTVNGVEVEVVGAVATGTHLTLVNGVAMNIVDAAGMGDPCVAGGTVEFDASLIQVPSDATTFTFQTDGQAAAQTGLSLGDTVTLTADTPTDGICDSVGTVVTTIGVTGGTRDGLVASSYILLDDPTSLCGACGGP